MRAFVVVIAPPLVTLLGVARRCGRSRFGRSRCPPSCSAAFGRSSARSSGDAAAAWRLDAVTTAEGALAGFCLSALLGHRGGAGRFRSRERIERGLYPYALFLQTVPIVAIAPLLVLWFGPGLRAVSVSAFIVSVFPVIANTLSGLRGVDPRLSDLFRSLRREATRHPVQAELPFALPSIATGLRVASGLSVIGAIVGEFVAGFSEGRAGLGITVLAAYRQLRTDLLFAAVILASLLGLGSSPR